MTNAAVWLGIFAGIYAVALFALAGRSARSGAVEGRSFFAAGRVGRIGFGLGATATALPAFFVLGYPSLIRRDGFAAATLGFAAIGIGLASAALFKRLWLVGRRHGHGTAADVLAGYFGSEAVRLPIAVVALAFAIPFLGLELLASGVIAELATGGAVDRRTAAAAFGLLLVAVLGFGGFGALARVGAVQAGIVAAGLAVALVAAVAAAGGIGGFVEGLSRLAASGPGVLGTTRGRGGGDFHAFFAVAGVWPLAPAGGAGQAWTVTLGFSVTLAAIGMATSPGFCQWPLAASSPRPFAAHQLWGLAVGLGFALVVAAVALGVAGRAPGADPGSADVASLADDLGLAWGAPTPAIVREALALSAAWPWAAALAALAALAATQASAGLALIAGAMAPREIARWAGRPLAPEGERRAARAMMLAIVLVDLALVAAAPDLLGRYSGLALTFGLQMAPPLAAALWLPWITRRGAVAGLVAGLVVGALAETQAPLLAGLGIGSVGRWPLGIHSAVWGLAFNLVTVLSVSALTQDRAETERRAEWHGFLKAHADLPAERRPLVRLAWGATVLWAFLAIGPGATIGNDIFGAPETGASGWTFGIPSIWAWHIVLWLAGVGLVAFLGRRLGLAIVSPAAIEAARSGDPEGTGRK